MSDERTAVEVARDGWVNYQVVAAGQSDDEMYEDAELIARTMIAALEAAGYTVARLERHGSVPQPNWNTKIHCECGEQFTSRCEWALHAIARIVKEGE